MRDTERWQRHRQKEKQAPREPNAGLNPRTLGSCPELKADAQPLSHPAAPSCHSAGKEGERQHLQKTDKQIPGKRGHRQQWHGFYMIP